MQYNTQSRKYQLTINNPEKYGITRDVILGALNAMSLDYFCLSDEIASTGTPHTHIFLYSQSPIRFSTVQNRFKNAHIERAYGTVKENRDYIQKSGNWKDTDKAETVVKGSFFEWGDIPSEQMEKMPKMAMLIEAIKNGDSTVEIINNNPGFAFRVKDIDALREKLLAEKFLVENRAVTVHYIYGETGTGKTRSIYQKHAPSDVCRITTYKEGKMIFDAYHGQGVLVFEEFRSQVPIAEMLSYLDIYPLMLPARYNDRVACYHTVYIVSNIPLQEQYIAEQRLESVTWKAFLRRISTITEYWGNGLTMEHKKGEYNNEDK